METSPEVLPRSVDVQGDSLPLPRHHKGGLADNLGGSLKAGGGTVSQQSGSKLRHPLAVSSLRKLLETE